MEIQASNPGNTAYEMISISELNELLGNVANFYYQVTQHGFYLPEETKKTITVEYLYGVITQKYFSMKREEVKHSQTYKYVSKIDAYFELKRCATKELGFEINTLPNKLWMMDCLFTLQPGHSFFQPPQSVDIKRPFPAEFFFFNMR
jgi:hypothetical protein